MTTLIGQRATLLYNPASASGKAGKRAPQVIDALRSLNLDLHVHQTTSLEDARDTASRLDEDDLLISFGGDGLHAFAAAGAVDSGCRFAPLPGGRGNDFVRSLGGSTDPWEAVQNLIFARERVQDVGVVKDRIFLGVVGIGFDSIANAYANEDHRLMRGSSAYAYGAIRAAAQSRPQEFTITIDGESNTIIGRQVAIGQSGRYGGGMRICPEADPCDGLLDVTVVGDITAMQFPGLLRGVFSGKHLKHPAVSSFRGRTVKVETPGPFTLAFGDGDPIADAPFTVECRPSALRVMVPSVS